MNLTNITKADNLKEEDADLLQELVKVFTANLDKNQTRKAYYEDKVKAKNLGLACPADFVDINTCVGWAAKAVDMLASRSVFDGFTFAGGESEELDQVLEQNDFGTSYAMAVPSELVHGCGFWTVSQGDEKAGDPKVVVNYHNAESAAAVWDYRRKRVRAGFVIEDMARFGKSKEYIPSLVVMHTSEAVIELKRLDKSAWEATYKPHIMGRPMMESMVNKYRDEKPFGRSRISKTVMGIIDAMQRELLRTEFHSEFYSSPQKYLFGLTDEQFDTMKACKAQVYMTDILMTTRDDDGNVPTMGMLQQASMEPHLALMDKLANRMASETCLPVAAFGVAGNGYTSSDALRASTDDLVMEAETLNRINGKALNNVAKMILAVLGEKSFMDLDEEECSVRAHFKNPSMPSLSAQADALVKICSAPGAEWIADTDVFLEEAGFDETQRRRMNADKRIAQARQQVLMLEDEDADDIT